VVEGHWSSKWRHPNSFLKAKVLSLEGSPDSLSEIVAPNGLGKGQKIDKCRSLLRCIATRRGRYLTMCSGLCSWLHSVATIGLGHHGRKLYHHFRFASKSAHYFICWSVLDDYRRVAYQMQTSVLSSFLNNSVRLEKWQVIGQEELVNNFGHAQTSNLPVADHP
jgi:hypothetical protein